MRLLLIVAVCSWGAVQLRGDRASAEPKQGTVTDKEIGRVMEKTHRGMKSPHARTIVELKNESPNWETLAMDAKLFGEMGQLFNRRAGFSSTSPKLYIDSAAGLRKAVQAKDKAAALMAFVNLRKSCGACHRKTPIEFDRDGNVK